jgi:phospholipid/cholesterol/gamma-HCH transport system substrate-binding protein
MKRNSMTEFKVGVFASIGLLLAMLVIFMLGGENRFFERNYTIYSHFDNISGLRAGATVQLAGLKIGYVDNIRLSKNLDEKMMTVVLRIRRGFQDRIRKDSTATIETQGLLGDKFIYVTMGSEVQPVIPNKGTIESRVTTSIFSLADKAGTILDDIGDASESVKNALGAFSDKKGGGDIKASIKSIKNILAQIETGKGFIHAILYDPKGAQIVSAIADTMDSVRDIVATADKESEGQLGGLITNLRHASADLKTILATVRRGEGTVGRLINDPTLYNEIQAILGRANRSKLMRAVIRSTINEGDRQVLVK